MGWSAYVLYRGQYEVISLDRLGEGQGMGSMLIGDEIELEIALKV
jgi:hypothetical protein